MPAAAATTAMPAVHKGQREPRPVVFSAIAFILHPWFVDAPSLAISCVDAQVTSVQPIKNW
jgi:hypothetical protein